MSDILVENREYKNILNQRQIMRVITRNTTANCTPEIYTCYLLSDLVHATCTSLSHIMDGISHDSVSRFLLRENYTPKDLLRYRR